MAIEASEFMKELRISRAGIDPKEKLRQLQELKQQSQFKSPEKENGKWYEVGSHFSPMHSGSGVKFD